MSDIELVRSLYGDVEPDTDGNYIIPDATVQGFLTLSNGDHIMAASLACGAIAGSELYLSRVLRTDDLTINGAAAASEWRLRAKDLAEQSKQVDRGDLTVDFAYFPDASPFSDHDSHAEGTGFPCR